MSKIVITGAHGFIGRGLQQLLRPDHQLVTLSRHRHAEPGSGDAFQVDYCDPDQLAKAMSGADIVVHLADNANRTGREARAPIAAPQALMAAMQQAAVPRLIFASSVYARKYLQTGKPEYGAYKAQAEKIFRSADDIETLFLRLPPVYGPGGGGGFAALSKAVAKNLPLPVGRASAPRAYLSRNNLSDLIAALVAMDTAAWQQLNGACFEPSDAVPISTRDLVQMMKRVTASRSIIVPVPAPLFHMMGRAIGKSDKVDGIFGTLQTEENPLFRQLSGWSPREAMPESLRFLTKPD